MSKPQLNGNYLKPVLLVTLLTCICLAGLVFLNSFTEFDFSFLRNNQLLLPAILLQVIASVLFIMAWKILLSMQADTRFSFGECTAHIGITLLGKYLPGKIWGLVGRTYVLTKRGQSSSRAMSLLIADQFATFYTGIIIGVVALLAFFSAALATLTAVAAILSIPLAIKYYDSIIRWLTVRLKFLLKKLSKEIDTGAITINRRLLGLTFLIYAMHWISTSLVLCLLFYPLIAAELFLNSTLIVAAIPLAMLSGFLAFWAPGGIGVREGVIVAILTLQLPLTVAATIAISYRLICILIDLSIGGFALIFFYRTAPSLLQVSE